MACAATVPLTWDASVVDATHSAPTEYKMYRAVGSGSMQPLASIPAPTLVYTDTSPAPGQSCYEVTAANAGGESLPSNRVCFSVPFPPNPPANLRLQP